MQAAPAQLQAYGDSRPRSDLVVVVRVDVVKLVQFELLAIGSELLVVFPVVVELMLGISRFSLSGISALLSCYRPVSAADDRTCGRRLDKGSSNIDDVRARTRGRRLAAERAKPMKGGDDGERGVRAV